MPPRLALTPGEPAGIGPDITLAMAAAPSDAVLICIADPELLASRARRLGLAIELREVAPPLPAEPAPAGQLYVWPLRLGAPCLPGQLDPANARYVLDTLDRAVAACRDGTLDGLVTGPVHKALINRAGIPFSGHTEYLMAATGAPAVVMMLATPQLRVALATTHLPLRAVSDALSRRGLRQTLDILHRDLQARFGLAEPRIAVLGLNPHAGEDGHLGREEIELIEPVIAACRADGYRLTGPVPADTAFTPAALKGTDAVLAMYHDQGLPVLKAQGFGAAVNITLGLPLLRTSVDHGTALPLAGTGQADPSSMIAAIECATDLAIRSR